MRKQTKAMYLNGDFIMQVNASSDEKFGLSNQDIE